MIGQIIHSKRRHNDGLRQRFALILGLLSVVMISVPLSGHRVSAEPPGRADSNGTGSGGRNGVASPGTLLTNEVITVSWSGFNPTQTNGLYGVLIAQCTANPVSMVDCFDVLPYPDLANGTMVLSTTNGGGSGAARIEIRATDQLPLLACSSSNPCSVMVYENDGLAIPAGELPENYAVIDLTFASSQADCPPITDFDVRADGSATSAELFYDWSARLCTGSNSLVLDYTENSSTSGRENFLRGLTDIGVSALPATEEELSAHPEHRDFAYIPLVASAVVIAYNFIDPFTGTQLNNVVLSPRLVARIITNSSLETFFLDRELLRLNPGVRFPTGTLARPLLRAERNADTRILTSWFSSDPGAQLFLSGADAFRIPVNSAYTDYSYPQDLFETVSSDSEYFPRQGQRANALRLFYGVTPKGIFKVDTSLTGVVGIVDLPTAKRFGLKVARLAQPDGSVLAVTDETILAGLDDMDQTSQGFRVSDPSPDILTGYPLVKIDYALVPTMFSEQVKLEKVKRVLEFALNAGQTGLPSGYVALPEAIRLDGVHALEKVSLPSTTTTTTAPTTTTTTTAPATTTTAPATTTTALTTTTTAPATTTTALTTTTTSTTSTLAPITVPAAIGGLPNSQSKSAVLYVGLLGLSGATLLGTVRPRQRARRR